MLIAQHTDIDLTAAMVQAKRHGASGGHELAAEAVELPDAGEAAVALISAGAAAVELLDAFAAAAAVAERSQMVPCGDAALDEYTLERARGGESSTASRRAAFFSTVASLALR